MYRAFCWSNLKERDYLENLRVDMRIILKSTLNKYEWRGGAVDSSGSRQGQMDESVEYENDPSSTKKCEEIV
jgi:hypothetical protein